MKSDQSIINNDRKSQGEVSTMPPTPRKENKNRKGEEKKKIKPEKLTHAAGQNK